MLSKINRVKSLSKSGNPKKDQAVSSLPPSNKDASSASSLSATADVEDVYERQQEVKVVDTGRRAVEKDVHTVDFDKQPSTFTSSYPFNGREESGMASGPTDREKFEMNHSYGGPSSQRVHSSNSQNSADTEEKVQKVSPPRRKVTREEKSEKIGNLAKKDGGGSELSTTNSRQTNAVNYNNTNNVGHRKYDPEPPTDRNINAILEVCHQYSSFCFYYISSVRIFFTLCVLMVCCRRKRLLLLLTEKKSRTQWRLFVK